MKTKAPTRSRVSGRRIKKKKPRHTEPWKGTSVAARLYRAAERHGLHVKDVVRFPDVLAEARVSDWTADDIEQGEAFRRTRMKRVQAAIAENNARAYGFANAAAYQAALKGVDPTDPDVAVPTPPTPAVTKTKPIEKPPVENDWLGNRIGSQGAEINRCLTRKPQTVASIAKACGLSPGRVKGHLKSLQLKGHVDDTNRLRKRKPAETP